MHRAPRRLRRVPGRWPIATLAVALAACAPAATQAPPVASGSGPSASRPAGDPRADRFVDSVLALMTLEEKLGQLNQRTGPELTGPGAAATLATTEADLRAGRVGSYLNVVGAEETRRLQRVAMESRLRIPLLYGYDVIHGFRTTFPVPLAQASSWDTASVARAARIAAVEAAASGIHWTFAPMVDIARDPRWGRVVEGAGEDPYLGSAMAAAAVRGYQGTDLAADSTILATAKHYAAYGAAEGGRDYDAAEVSERTLREIYLPPFEAAVRAGAGSIMAAFNEVAGVPMHANEALLRGVLRREWGFDGLVVSDWTGIQEMLAHGVGEDSAAVGALALRAGVDMDMVSEIYQRKLAPLVRSGAVPQALVDGAVRRVLHTKYRLGLFADPYRYSDTARQRARTLTPASVALARDLARRSIVLLKNEGNVLPLRKDLGTVAVIGALATDSASALGPWSAQGRAEDAVPVLTGVRRAVSPGTRVLYARGAAVNDADTSGFAEAERVARAADAVVLVLGEHRDMSAEAKSRASIALPGVQQRLADRVLALGKPVVVVLTNGRPLAIPELAARAPAIVESWFLGVQTGPAVADVLFGDHSPSGKLPISFPRTTGQVPIYYNRKNTGRPSSAAGDYEPYRSNYIDVKWTPLFPFGHGLSYTIFGYGEPRLSATRVRAGDSVTVTVEVTNTGQRAGDEVVQLYLRDEVASVTPAVKRLRGFRRVALQPGERRTVSFVLRREDLEFWGPDMRPTVEPGFFTVTVGGSSDGGRSARFEVVR